MVEVEPITCWWRTSTSAVRTGEPFGLTLTCSVVETEATKVVPDFSKLDADGGAAAAVRGARRHARRRPGDARQALLPVPTTGCALIAEDAFGADVAVPPLEVTYRIESKVAGGDVGAGPRPDLLAAARVDPPDLARARRHHRTSAKRRRRRSRAIEARDSRANLLQTVAGVLFGLAGVVVLVMLIGMLRQQDADSDAARVAHLAPRAILRRRRERAGRGAAGQPRRLDAGTGRPRAVGAAHRRQLCAPAAPSASGRSTPATTPPTASCSSSRPFGRGDAFVSGSVDRRVGAADGATAGLADALKRADGRALRPRRARSTRRRRSGADRDPHHASSSSRRTR